ncbi:HalOD1 output domain-containing protein [Haloarcula rubripromontorii]|uniref:HalOD1 output domain-containing protein n=1 Tax=Haloarcula rubripromontorii TaxID=1705562 RepID=UPI003B8A6B6E
MGLRLVSLMTRATDQETEFRGSESVLHESQYDPENDQQLIHPILETVAMLGERPVKALQKDPLHESIDIEAVESLLFGPERDSSTDGHRQTVSFEYSGYRIHIHGDGRILLSDADGPTN